MSLLLFILQFALLIIGLLTLATVIISYQEEKNFQFTEMKAVIKSAWEETIFRDGLTRKEIWEKDIHNPIIKQLTVISVKFVVLLLYIFMKPLMWYMKVMK